MQNNHYQMRRNFKLNWFVQIQNCPHWEVGLELYFTYLLANQVGLLLKTL